MSRPNIVLVLIDDLGWADLGCYGSTFYETPHLDRLAQQGVRFTQAYASAPVCSPTRASLLTGKYPATVGVTDWIGGHAVGPLGDVPYFSHLPLHEVSLASALQAQGYRTWHVGKWHLGGERTWPQEHGFDVNIGGSDRGRPSTYTSPYELPNLTDGPPGEYLTDRLTDEAITLIRQTDDRPFFLNLWHYAVHTPIEAPDHLVAKYVAKATRLGLDQIDPFELGEPMQAWHLAGQVVRRRTVQSDPHYAAMVENLDTNMGRLLEALDDNGVADDTIVLFTSDNGGLATAQGSPTTNAPLSEGKGWTAEGGVREPLIARWPGRVPAGVESDVVWSSPDLFPTVLSLVGCDLLPEQHVDGVDLSAALLGEPVERGPVFWHYPHYGDQGGSPSAAVRWGRWKLVRDFADGASRLYDLETDVAERDDLASTATAERDRLDQALDEWLRDVRALVPRPNPRHRPMPTDVMEELR